MNSITQHLTAQSLAATALMLRSKKAEIFMIVEGDDDIALFSNALGLPQANFVSCNGKERLMEVFGLAPRRGLDDGAIFIRDADFDDVVTHERDGVLLVCSNRYDFEMSLLPPRVFSRIFSEFMKGKATPELVQDAFEKIVAVASYIGATRHVSIKDEIHLDFKKLKLSFIDGGKLNVDPSKMVRYFLQKSGISLSRAEEIETKVLERRNSATEFVEVTSGKDFLRVCSLALSKHYKCCLSTECTFETLSRMFRMTVIQDDLRELPAYSDISSHAKKTSFEWVGNVL